MLPKALRPSGKLVVRSDISEGGGLREKRIPDGMLAVGVEGSTLTELCGDLPSREPDADDSPEGDAMEALEVLEAFECECWCFGL